MADPRPFTAVELRQLNDVLKELSTDRYMVFASPGTIRNNGRNLPAIEVRIGDNQTGKIRPLLYRDAVSGFRNWLKKQMDAVAVMDNLPPAQPEKPKNSL